jgi:hypothetical protein
MKFGLNGQKNYKIMYSQLYAREVYVVQFSLLHLFYHYYVGALNIIVIIKD